MMVERRNTLRYCALQFRAAGITHRKKVIPAPKTSLILSAPCSLRGALMRRLERGAGRRRDRRTGPCTPAAGARQFRALAGAAPADEARTLVLGRRRGSAWRYYGLLPGAG